MAIGVAMLGFGVSGTMLALAGRVSSTTRERWFAWSSVLTVLMLIVGPGLALRVPLDPTQLPWDPSQWLRLGMVYLLLAIPFTVGATAVLLALTLEMRRPGLVYGASFAGSGLGAAAAIAVLAIAPPDRVLVLPCVLAGIAGLVASVQFTERTVRRSGAAAAGAGGAALAILCITWSPWSVSVSQYKGLPQVEAFPGARRVVEYVSPVGWLVAVNAPAFRYAPGLSLGFQDSIPGQTALFVDGEISGSVPTRESRSEFYDWLPTALPYAAGEIGTVLVVGAGGGTEVRNALAHGARLVKAVELHPDAVRLAGSVSDLRYGAGRVEWTVGDIRSFASRSANRYDLITLAPAGAMGGSTAGVHSLREDFLHTVEAYVSYLGLLSDDGIMAVTRWVTVPNRESARAVLTAAEALRRVAPDAIRDGLVVMRSWGTATVLAKPAGFSPDEIASLDSWATKRLFDIDWRPGLDAPSTRFHHTDSPTLFEAVSAAVAGHDSLRHFAAAYPFEIAPASDARPYPHHFLRLSSLGRLLRTDRGSWLPVAEWGPIALTATVIQSMIIAGLLMIVPAALKGRRGRGPGWLALVGYFSAIGFGYLAAEIAAIQQLGLLLGHPVYAVAAVLTAFLLCSGVGSAVSDRLNPPMTSPIAITLTGILIGCALLLLHLVHAIQGEHIVVRLSVAVAALAPLAFLMGIPFPLALRHLVGEEHARVAWAWAANGFASVVAAPVAALIALEAGSPALFGAAAAAYGAAAALAARRNPAAATLTSSEPVPHPQPPAGTPAQPPA